MNKIRLPKERAYYLASEKEKDRLLCWIPVEEYDRLSQEGRVPAYVPEDYPDGLELEVSRAGFNEFQVDLGVSPEAIQEVYHDLMARGLLPPSGTVAGAKLESIARNVEQRGSAEVTGLEATVGGESVLEELPEPAMTEGEDPMVAMRELE